MIRKYAENYLRGEYKHQLINRNTNDFMQMQHKNKRRLYTYKIKKGFTKLEKMEENHGLQEHYTTDHKNEGLV